MPSQGYRINLQYVLVGAGLGLYYGMTYKGLSTEPQYLRVLIWSLLAALLTVVIRSWKKGLSAKTILMDYLKMAALYTLFLLGLELRKPVGDWGGKIAVIAFTTFIGALLGGILGTAKRPVSTQSQSKEKGG